MSGQDVSGGMRASAATQTGEVRANALGALVGAKSLAPIAETLGCAHKATYTAQ